MVKLTKQRFWIGPTLELDLLNTAVMLRGCHVSSWGRSTVSNFSGWKFRVFDSGIAWFVMIGVPQNVSFMQNTPQSSLGDRIFSYLTWQTTNQAQVLSSFKVAFKARLSSFLDHFSFFLPPPSTCRPNYAYKSLKIFFFVMSYLPLEYF